MSTAWQDKLEEICREYQYQAPQYQDVSDRRGGRTAWSCTVIFGPNCIGGRYWYDGANINNAREDAAETAIIYLNSKITSSPAQSRHGSSSTWSSS